MSFYLSNKLTRIVNNYAIVLSLTLILSCSQRMKSKNNEFENIEFVIEQEHNFKSVFFKLENGLIVRIESEVFLDMVVEKVFFYINNCEIVKVVEVKETYSEPIIYNNAKIISTIKDSSQLKSKVSLKPFMDNRGTISGEYDGIITLKILQDDLLDITKNSRKQYLALLNKISKCSTPSTSPTVRMGR